MLLYAYMDNTFVKRVAFAAALGLSAVSSPAEAGPFGDISYARQDLADDTQQACGRARVEAAEERRRLRLADFDLAAAETESERLSIRREILEIQEAARVERQEIIADLQEDTIAQSDILGRRAMAQLSSNAPVFIAQCARSGQ